MTVDGVNDTLLDAALAAFRERGFEGSTTRDILDALDHPVEAPDIVGLREQALALLVAPLIEELECVLDLFPRHPTWPDQGRALLAAYLNVLLVHSDVAAWIDTDIGALANRTLGRRLAEVNRRAREAIRGDNRSAAARMGATAALGTLWRPLRNLPESDLKGQRDALLDAAMAVAMTVRAGR